MKSKSLWIAPLCAALFSLTFFACKKDITVVNNDKNGVSYGAFVGYMTAMVEGDSFVSSGTSAVISDSDIVINSTTLDDNNIQLVITTTKMEEGIFVINSTNKHSAAYEPFNQAPFVAKTNNNGGQIRITKFDTVNKRIAGIFYFDGTRTGGGNKVVTDGRFEVSYKLEKSPPRDPNDTVFSVNPKAYLSTMSAIIKSTTDTDTVAFSATESWFLLGNLYLSGIDSTKQRITIAVEPSAFGSFSLQGNFGPNSAYYVSKAKQTFTAESGTFDISENDTISRHLKGTFNFTGKISNSNPAIKRDILRGQLEFYY